MTDECLKTLSLYVRFIANKMRRVDWQIACEYDAQLQGSLATIDITPGRHEATITFGPMFALSGDEDQRYAVVHELCHLPLHAIRQTLQTAQPLLGMSWGMLHAAHDNGIEDAGHYFSGILAPMFPTVPEWMMEHKPALKKRRP